MSRTTRDRPTDSTSARIEALLEAARRTRGFMPDDEGEALFEAALRARPGRRPGREARDLRRDRRLVRQVDRLPRRGGRGHRSRPALRRPPPRLGGEPARVGVPRGRPRRRRGRAASTPCCTGVARLRRRVSSRPWWASSATRPPWRRAGTGRWRSASSTAGTARSRPGPTSGAGRPTSPLGGWLAIHDVFPDPADGGRPPYELYCAALDSGEFVEDAACGSLRVLRRIRPDAPLGPAARFLA